MRALQPPASGVFGTTRSCLATPPEVTAAVAEERRMLSCPLWSCGTQAAPAQEAEVSVQMGSPRALAKGHSAGAGRRLGLLLTSGLGWWGGLGTLPAWCLHPHLSQALRRTTPTRFLRLPSRRTRQVCARAGPRLGACGPQTSLRVEGEGQSSPLTIET